MADFDKIRQLHDALVRQEQNKNKRKPQRKFLMSTYLAIVDGRGKRLPYEEDLTYSIAELRTRPECCNTAACLAGETVISLGNPNYAVLFCRASKPVIVSFSKTGNTPLSSIPGYASNLLDLSEQEADWMFLGRWQGDRQCDTLYGTPTRRMNVHGITRKQAIKYLNKVIKEQSVFVTTRRD